jgi:hypothetical protein
MSYGHTPPAAQNPFRRRPRCRSPLSLRVDAAIEALLKSRKPLWRHPGVVLTAIGAAALHYTLVSRAERRRAQALGLTAETAPVSSVAPDFLLLLLIGLAYNVWVRVRTGTWPRLSPSAVAASNIVREVNRRRSCKAALAAQRRSS